MISFKKYWIAFLVIGFTVQAGAAWNDPFHQELAGESKGRICFVDSRAGDDHNSGLSEMHPWKSLQKVQRTEWYPGDVIRFKRGSKFDGALFIHSSGSPHNYITLTDYGNVRDSAPQFTNTGFGQGNFGNCIRITGRYVTVENLFFYHTPTFVEGNYRSDGGWIEWEMGAIYIDKGAEHCIVRNNEIFDCVAAIRSYGKYAQIDSNYIHDCNRPLRKWNWGPIGIWIGEDYQTIVGNTIINMQISDPDPSHFTNGVGGGAFEIDDGRYPKSHISISRNFTRDNCGFLETVFNDVVKNPEYKDWNISFNISDDYQAFVKLRFAKNCSVDNNTILRRKINATELGVFVFKGNNTFNKVRNNIIVTDDDVKIFNVVGKAHPSTVIANNLYYAESLLVMGNEGPGSSPYYHDPLFNNIRGSRAEDFAISPESPGVNKAMDLGYLYDFKGRHLPCGKRYDLGAWQCNDISSIKNKQSTK
jgi:hypothetical protein